VGVPSDAADMPHLRPYLARDDAAHLVLVEDTRRRVVGSPALETALQPILGPLADARAIAEVPLASGTPLLHTEADDIQSLIALSPESASIAVFGVGELGPIRDRSVLRLPLDRPDRLLGNDLLDRLARARMRGADHLVVAVATANALLDDHNLLDFLARRAQIVAANGAGVMWSLPPAPASGTPKILVIGLGKTGTTSVHRALGVLGIAGLHWGGRPAFRAVLRAQREGTRLLHYVGEQYPSYDDIETLSVRFDLADLQYPGSRFILTVRDLDAWVASRHRHVERNLRKRDRGKYSGTNFGLNEETWRAQWNGHLARVSAWFADRDDLLVFDVAAGDGWEQLAPFVGRPVPGGPFPYENVGGDDPDSM
jgi:Sulfotransferase domain